VETGKLMDQIRLRGREYEQSIREEYLFQIQEAYFMHLKTLTNSKILLIDITGINFIKRSGDYRDLIAAITSNEYPNGVTRLVL